MAFVPGKKETRCREVHCPEVTAGWGMWQSKEKNRQRENAQHFEVMGKTPSSSHISGVFSKWMPWCPGQVKNWGMATVRPCSQVKGRVLKYGWSYAVCTGNGGRPWCALRGGQAVGPEHLGHVGHGRLDFFPRELGVSKHGSNGTWYLLLKKHIPVAVCWMDFRGRRMEARMSGKRPQQWGLVTWS